MQGEINQIEIKLPALEEEKKSYIQIKNFKEAGRVSKELKESIEKKNKNIAQIQKRIKILGWLIKFVMICLLVVLN